MTNPEMRGVISGEINDYSTETQKENAVDEWLVFVEENIGELSDGVKDQIKMEGASKKMNLKDFTETLITTMEKVGSVDINIINKLKNV